MATSTRTQLLSSETTARVRSEVYVLKPSEMTHADDCCAPWQMRPESKQQQQTAIRRPISPCPLHKAVCLGTKQPPPKGIKVLQLPPTLLTHTQRCRRTEVVTVMSPGTGQKPFHRSPTERAVRGTEACSEQWSLTTTIFFFCFVSMVSIVLALGTTEQHYGVNCATLPKRRQYSID